MKAILRRTIRTLGKGIGLLLLLVLALELLFRGGCFDPYKTEWNFLNPEPSKTSSDRRVLVMGDSFTASPANYAEQLRKRLPDWHIANAAVPGTSVHQAALIASRRLSEIQPQTLIYQIYLGNDLLDLRHPTNWNTLSTSRNLYWTTANHLRSLEWLNYKLGQWQAPPDDHAKQSPGPFDPDTYSPRQKMLLQAMPDLIGAQSQLAGSCQETFGLYLDHLRSLLDQASQHQCRTILLLIPHCAETAPRYRERMQQLGATFPHSDQRPQAFEQALRSALADRPAVTILNATTALTKQCPPNQPCYFENDPHLNPRGHQILADLLQPHLLKP